MDLIAPSQGEAKVSCLAAILFLNFLESRGISCASIQDQLPMPIEYLRDRSHWMSYASLERLEKLLEALFVDTGDIHFQMGRSIQDSKTVFSLIGIAMRSVFSPFQALNVFKKYLPVYFFRGAHLTVERKSKCQAEIQYIFMDGYQPTDAWRQTTIGILHGQMELLGYSRFAVDGQQTQKSVATFLVNFEPQWLGLIDFIQQKYQRLSQLVKNRLVNRVQAKSELELTNERLEKKVAALTFLSHLSQTIATSLDPMEIAERAAVLITQKCGGPGASIVLYDQQHRAVFSNVAHMDKQCLIEHQADAINLTTIAGYTIYVLAIDSDILGHLAVETAPSDYDDGLLRAAAGQIAVAIANAPALQFAQRLSEELEDRVRERTMALVNAKKTLQDTVGRLERSDQSTRDFFTNVSHEFRTPLTLILAPLDELKRLLQEAGAGSAVNEHVEMIERNARGLLRLVNEILDYARLDAQQMPIDPLPVEVGCLIRNLVESLQPLAEARDITLVYDGPSLDVIAMADQRMLSRAFTNLLANAIKYIRPKDHVMVCVHPKGDDIVIDVIDTGPGIPMARRELIFERFQRLQDGKGNVATGTGIGLAMVREILALHNGSVELLDTEEGAHFHCRLPLTAVSPASTPSPHVSTLPLDATVEDLLLPEIYTPEQESSKIHVLLVEDDPEMRHFLHTLISRNYRCSIAKDAQVGLVKARETCPDLIVSDIMMPVMNGLEMCRAIKKDPVTASIPVMLVSAVHGTNAAVNAFSAGADDFVSKPFSPSELLARIAVQVRLRILQQAMVRMEKQATLGMVAGGIAHEVLNPVNVVLTAIPPLRKQLEAIGSEALSKSVKLLDIVESSGRRIESVVVSVLHLARNPRPEEPVGPIEVEQALKTVCTLLKHRMDNIKVSNRTPEDLVVYCHHGMLVQVLTNLLTNAIDAMDGKGQIEFLTQFDGRQVSLWVKDSGPGILGSAFKTIFEPFYTTKAPGKGTGLGLPISRKMIEWHGGELRVEPSEGGASFVIVLPGTCMAMLKASLKCA